MRTRESITFSYAVYKTFLQDFVNKEQRCVFCPSPVMSLEVLLNLQSTITSKSKRATLNVTESKDEHIRSNFDLVVNQRMPGWQI